MNNLMLLLVLFAQGGASDEKPADSEEMIKKASYVLGFQFGKTMGQDGVEIDMDLFVQGVMAGKSGQSQFSDTEMRQILGEFQQVVRKLRTAKREKIGSENKKKADSYLSQNKTKDGVVALDSGLQYKVLTAADGPKPKVTDRVSVHYRGRLIDGTEFDSSYKRNQPTTFRVNGVIPGWIEALQLMSPGAKWEVTIPPELGYGLNGTPTIPSNSLLIFEIELLEIVQDEKDGEAKIKKEN